MKKWIISALVSSICVMGFADNINSQLTTVNKDGSVEINTNALTSLTNAKAQDIDHHQKQRSAILTANGLRVGQQFGFAMELKYLQKKLEKASGALNQIFNFNFILSYANQGSPAVNILPPVLLSAQNYVEGQGQQAISIANDHYTLYRQASLVTVVPSWRDYLIQAIPIPENVPNAYLPHDSDEQTIWRDAVDKGVKLGVQQAVNEMNYRINLLDRDYNGMLTYLRLLDAGKVSSPYIAYTHQSVVGNSQAMSVNQDVYRITSHSKLITNPNRWKFLGQEKIKP